MKIYYSELCLVNENLFDSIKRLMDHGADHIELMLDGRSWDGYENRMDELCVQLNNYPVTYAIHSPVWNFNLAAASGYIREATLKAYKDSIIFAHKLKASHVVLHPGFADIPHDDKNYLKELAGEAVIELSRFNESYQVDLLIENVGNNSTSIFTMEEYVVFLNGLPDYMKYIVDLGHANITGWDIPLLIKRLGSRLKAFHINDNDGERDIHMAMDEGTVNWKEVFQSIRAENRSYDLILEYNVRTDLRKLEEGKIRLTEELLKFRG